MKKLTRKTSTTKKAKKSFFLAKVLAGVSLLASVVGYGFYLVTRGKKPNFKKMKISIWKGADKLHGEVNKGVKSAEKTILMKMKQMKK